MGRPANPVYEVWLPRTNFIHLSDFSEEDFRMFVATHEIKPDDRGYYPVMEICKRLNLMRKRGRWGMGDADTALKLARLKKVNLDTSIKAKEYMKIADAKMRIRTILLAVADKIKYAIKLSSPKVIMMSDAKLIENILILDYNNSINLLLEEADQIKDWESHGQKLVDSFQGPGNQLVENSDASLGIGSSQEDQVLPEGECT